MENQNPNSTAVRKQPPKSDRLSSLPDVILEEILSLLPTSAAAATSVLSRRWGQLWTRVTHLHFESYDVDLRTFLASVDSALCHIDSFSNIRYFYLRFNPTAVELRKIPGKEEEDIFNSFLNRWLSRLCGLHSQRIDVGGRDSDFVQICVQNSVVAKTINSVSDDDDVGLESSNCRAICLPQCVFQSETLTELLLDHWFRFKLPEFVNLPNLKKLSLQVFDSDRDLMRTLFKSLPSLEDLTLLSALRRNDHCIEISALNLKKICLKFCKVLYKAQILIDTPKLEHISILNGESSLFIRFVSIPSALSSAELILDARCFLGDDPVNQTKEFLKGISCVKSLAIFYPAVGIFNRVNMDALPWFQNLTHLDLLYPPRNYNFDIPVWLLRKVKTMDIKACWEYFEMSAVKNILSRADALERFSVSFSGVQVKQIDLQQKEEALVRALFMLPRVSTRCEIQFKGMVVSASTNDS